MALLGGSPEARERMLREARDAKAVEFSNWASGGIRDLSMVPLRDGSQARVFSGQRTTEPSGATATAYLLRDEQGNVKIVREGDDPGTDEIIGYAREAAEVRLD